MQAGSLLLFEATLGDLSYDNRFVLVHTRYPDYQSEQIAIAGTLRQGPASESHNMRSSMFVAYSLTDTGDQDLIVAAVRTKSLSKTANIQ
jgi:hypothetical protein